MRPGALWYHIEPDKEGLSIQMRLVDPPPRATFFLPGSWAGNEFDKIFSLEQARSPDGALAMSINREQGRIDIDTDGADWIELAYRIDTRSKRTEESRFYPWRDERAFFAYAPTILILPSAGITDQLRDIPIEVHVPGEWTLAATWPRERREVDAEARKMSGFIADDVRSLRDAFIAGSKDWRRLEGSLPGGALMLTLTDEFAFDDDRLLEAATVITRRYLSQFGGYDEISGIVLPLPDDAPDTLRGTGRHGGFVLEIPKDHRFDDALLLLLAHEVLHIWNGHQLVPRAAYRDEAQWFKEGVTHYLALKTLAQLGLVDEQTIRDELATAGRLYLHSPLVTGGHIRSIDRLRFPYDQGLLIALSLDLKLLRETNGAIGIEDWISTLLSAPFEERGQAYDGDVLRESFAHLTAEFGDDLLRKYRSLVESNDQIDVAKLFRSAGLHFLQTDYNNRSRLLPIDEKTAPFDALFSSPAPSSEMQ